MKILTKTKVSTGTLLMSLGFIAVAAAFALQSRQLSNLRTMNQFTGTIPNTPQNQAISGVQSSAESTWTNIIATVPQTEIEKKLSSIDRYLANIAKKNPGAVAAVIANFVRSLKLNMTKITLDQLNWFDNILGAVSTGKLSPTEISQLYDAINKTDNLLIANRVLGDLDAYMSNNKTMFLSGQYSQLASYIRQARQIYDANWENWNSASLKSFTDTMLNIYCNLNIKLYRQPGGYDVMVDKIKKILDKHLQ